jgi:DNA-binding GntR family transcriptional regulator
MMARWIGNRPAPDVPQTKAEEMSEPGVGLIDRDNLTARVYQELRLALMEGRFQPGHRFKIRDLAQMLGVSLTPVREALMQLVRERALDMSAGRAIEVARLTLAQYQELRTVRTMLEGLAAEKATSRITALEVRRLTILHAELIDAEESSRWSDAVRVNWQFHHTLYKNAEMPELLILIETIWLRNGPLLNLLYPHAPPTYPGRHQHLNVIEGLHARNPAAVKEAIQADILEGGAGLVRFLEQLEAGASALHVRQTA